MVVGMRCRRWSGAATLASMIVLPLCHAGAQEMPDVPEPFDAIPDGLYSEAAKAIENIEWLRGGTLEYVVITTDLGSKVFKLAEMPESLYELEDIETPEKGEIVRIPRWSATTGEASLINPDAEKVKQFIVIVTSSPGSGNDCRRGGSCRGADKN